MSPTTTTAGELELAGWRRQAAEPYATIGQTPPHRRDARCASPVATGWAGPAWVAPLGATEERFGDGPRDDHRSGP
jgi:hypothetical protein